MRVDVRVLGDFTVCVDGVLTPANAWRRRQAASLVKILALVPSRRLHRERVIDLLWPDVLLDAAGPRLHKAAHFARQTLRHRGAIVLSDNVVSLFPGATVTVDAVTFEAAAEGALALNGSASSEACAMAIDPYGGDLLPDDLYEAWCEDDRSRLQQRFLHLLRGAGRWEDVLAIEPADEQAHLELLRAAVSARDRFTALHRYSAMERALRDELGVSRGPEAVALRERILAVTSAPDDGRPPMRPAARGRVVAAPAGEVLLERDAALGELAAAISAAADDGRGSVVLVSGEAGAGKTSLVSAFLERMPLDVDGVVGGCDDLLASRSLGPFRDMATTHSGVEAALDADHVDDVFGALLRVLAARPTVIVVEDIHWADDATLDAIRYLSRRIPGVPSVLVLTFRDGEVDADHPLRQLLGSLTGRSVRRIALEPLSEGAVARLTAACRQSGIDVAELHRVTKGNPFFVTEVLASGGEDVPWTVRDAVLARSAQLAPDTRSLIERLAVVPTRAERWLAEALAGGDAEVVVRAERSGMITGRQAHVSFRHELARRAVETSLTDAERVRANADVVTALLGRSAIEPSRIVHHAERAQRTDLLLRHGPGAAEDAIRVGAHRQAAETLRLVLEHSAELDDSAAARLSTQRAYSLYVVNQFDDAFACAERAVAVAQHCGDSTVLADALLTLSRAALFAVGPSRARDAARQAVDILESDVDDIARLAAALADLARAHSNLPTVGIVAEPSADSAAFAERALALSEQIGRDDLRSQALCYLGSSRLADGDERGFADLQRAIAVSAADPRTELKVRIYVNAAGSAYRAGRLDDAQRYVAAGLRLAPDGELFAGECGSPKRRFG